MQLKVWRGPVICCKRSQLQSYELCNEREYQIQKKRSHHTVIWITLAAECDEWIHQHARHQTMQIPKCVCVSPHVSRHLEEWTVLLLWHCLMLCMTSRKYTMAFLQSLREKLCVPCAPSPRHDRTEKSFLPLQHGAPSTITCHTPPHAKSQVGLCCIIPLKPVATHSRLPILYVKSHTCCLCHALAMGSWISSNAVCLSLKQSLCYSERDLNNLNTLICVLQHDHQVEHCVHE